MAVYHYHPLGFSQSNMDKSRKYCAQMDWVDVIEIPDEGTVKDSWSKRKIAKLLAEANSGDHLVAYDASVLACSTSQVLDILKHASDKGVHVHFVSYDLMVDNSELRIDTQHLLKVISKIESDFISKRTTEALARRRAAGFPLGRVPQVTLDAVGNRILVPQLPMSKLNSIT